MVLDAKCDATLTELNVLRGLRVGDSLAPSGEVSGREPGVLLSSKGAETQANTMDAIINGVKYYYINTIYYIKYNTIYIYI